MTSKSQTVAVLFPSSPPKTEDILPGALTAVSAFDDCLKLHLPRSISARRVLDGSDYLAGTDATRCQELCSFLDSSDHSVAWFGRGGYGLTRLLTQLSRHDFSTLSGPKRWMGYSDITALFAFCKSLDIPIECIHGPMLCAFEKQPNKREVLDALSGKAGPIAVDRWLGPNETFEGPIWGGNLAVLASLCGTPWLPIIKQGAIFLEDVDESPYRLDRYLTQLHDSGFFRHTQNVFLGTFTGFEPAELAFGSVLERCRQLGLSVLAQLPIGHSEPHWPLFLDRWYHYTSESNTLIPQ